MATQRAIARRAIKKKISSLKYFKNNLPRLIDCSEVYGDKSFSEQDYKEVDEKIAAAKNELEKFDIENPLPKCL